MLFFWDSSRRLRHRRDPPQGLERTEPNLIPRRGSSHEKAGSQSRPFCHLERQVTTHDAIGSNLPPARLARIHQRQVDGRDSEQRDHRRLLRVALHAVVVRSPRVGPGMTFQFTISAYGRGG